MLIEHIINGFHFMILIIIILLCCFGSDFFEPLFTYLKDNNELTVPFFMICLPVIYTLGLIIDHFVDDYIFSRLEKRIRKESKMGDKSSRELIMLTNDQNQASQLDLIRTKIRITRTASFTYLFITIFTLIFIIFRKGPDSAHYYSLILSVLIGGSSLTLLSFLSWKGNTETFCKRVIDGYKILNKKYKKEQIS